MAEKHDLPGNMEYEYGSREHIVHLAINAKYGTMNGMARTCGISYSTIRNVLNRGIDNSTTSTVKKIMSAVYGDDGMPKSVYLTPDEHEIIDLYRRISPEGKQAIMTLIKGIEQKFEMQL